MKLLKKLSTRYELMIDAAMDRPWFRVTIVTLMLVIAASLIIGMITLAILV